MDCYLEISKEKMILIESFEDIVGDVVFNADKKSGFFDFFSLFDHEIPYIISEKYQKMLQSLNIPDHRGVLTIPQQVTSKNILNLKKAIGKVKQSPENKGYLVTYLQIKKFLSSLAGASVSVSMLNDTVANIKNPSVMNTARSFLPGKGHTCKKVQYSTTKTVTGRLTVIAGPKILTAPKSIKSCIKSSYKNGKVIQVDIISAEPKFALHVKGGNVCDDVYEDIVNNVIKENLSRSQAKLITLCALYGQSPKKLKQQLPDNVDAYDVIKKTREYFGYNELVSKLMNDFSENNFRNAFGRPIKLDTNNTHYLVSYFLQSSIAEGSILMFADFVDRHQTACRPIFVIHDALILDCKESFANSLLEKKNVDLCLGNWKFSTHISTL